MDIADALLQHWRGVNSINYDDLFYLARAVRLYWPVCSSSRSLSARTQRYSAASVGAHHPTASNMSNLVERPGSVVAHNHNVGSYLESAEHAGCT
jgi:hypothetical protein